MEVIFNSHAVAVHGIMENGPHIQNVDGVAVVCGNSRHHFDGTKKHRLTDLYSRTSSFVVLLIVF